MTDQLEPCPFCGGEAHLSIYYDFYRFGCSTKGCQCELPEIFNGGSTDNNWYGSIKKAKDAWNRRYKRTCKEYESE